MHCDSTAGRLHGFAVGPRGPLALHLHGTWGNFYENPFVTALAGTYLRQGWRYASVNLPSHDGGSVGEVITESLDAVRDWIKALTSDGEPLVLQGHSLGALKAIRLMSHPEYRDVADRVSGLVLLSPFDIVAFYGGDAEAAVRARHLVEAEMARAGDAANVPSSVFDLWPLSARLFLDMTTDDGEWDIFPSRAADTLRQRMAGIGRSTLVGIGGDDFAAYPDPATVAASLDGVPGVTVALVPGAPHAFAGHEDVLGEHVGRFLATLR